MNLTLITRAIAALTAAGAVVAGLGADLERRDAEVVLLRKQVDIERKLTATNDE